MGNCEEDKCCSEKSCCSEECCSSEMSMGSELMKLADQAWASLMIEKMKKALEKEKGEKMSKAAEVAVEASIAFWEGKMHEKAKWSEFEEKLKKAMN